MKSQKSNSRFSRIAMNIILVTMLGFFLWALFYNLAAPGFNWKWVGFQALVLLWAIFWKVLQRKKFTDTDM